MGKPANFGIKLLIIALFAVFMAVWIAFRLPCVFRHVTGLPCPTCGMTRAWLSALRLDFGAAFSYHPMFWVVPPLVLFGVYDGALFKSARLNKLFLLVGVGGLLICYLIRLICFLSGSLPL